MGCHGTLRRKIHHLLSGAHHKLGRQYSDKILIAFHFFSSPLFPFVTKCLSTYVISVVILRIDV